MYVCMYVPGTHGVEALIAPNHVDRLGRGLVRNLAGVAVVRGASSPAHVSDFLGRRAGVFTVRGESSPVTRQHLSLGVSGGVAVHDSRVVGPSSRERCGSSLWAGTHPACGESQHK